VKIAVVRSGGFAGITLRSEVDTATLPPEEAREWESLVAAADLRSIAAGTGRRHGGRSARGVPDAFQYDLTVEDEGRRTQVTAGESELPPPAKELVQRLVQHGR
jgi:hypothetical protein